MLIVTTSIHGKLPGCSRFLYVARRTVIPINRAIKIGYASCTTRFRFVVPTQNSRVAVALLQVFLPQGSCSIGSGVSLSSASSVASDPNVSSRARNRNIIISITIFIMILLLVVRCCSIRQVLFRGYSCVSSWLSASLCRGFFNSAGSLEVMHGSSSQHSAPSSFFSSNIIL